MCSLCVLYVFFRCLSASAGVTNSTNNGSSLFCPSAKDTVCGELACIIPGYITFFIKLPSSKKRCLAFSILAHKSTTIHNVLVCVSATKCSQSRVDSLYLQESLEV